MLAQSTDCVSQLTHGGPLSPLRWLFSGGLTVNTYSAVWEQDARARCFGRVCHAEGELYSRLDYIACAGDSSPDDLTCLLEALIQVSGTWGARYLLAELPESSDYLPAFRRADFSVWSQARVYRWSGEFDKSSRADKTWRPWTGQDVRAMQAMHRNTVPRLFQTIEPLSRKQAQGLAACSPQGSLLAFADLAYGPTGIYLQPMLDPTADHPSLIHALVHAVPNRLGRPIYLCARSYQALLIEALERLPFDLEQELALMVRHLAIKDKILAPGMQPVYESEKTEGSLPVIQSRQKGTK